MPCCAAVNCSSRDDKGARLCKFPADKERRLKWVQNSRRGSSWTPTNSSRLCEKHFENSEFECHRADGWRKLKPNAVPTLFDVANPPPMISPQSRQSFYKNQENDMSTKKKWNEMLSEELVSNVSNNEELTPVKTVYTPGNQTADEYWEYQRGNEYLREQVVMDKIKLETPDDAEIPLNGDGTIPMVQQESAFNLDDDLIKTEETTIQPADEYTVKKEVDYYGCSDNQLMKPMHEFSDDNDPENLHHGNGQLQPTKDPPLRLYECSWCDQKFSHKNTFLLHERKHTGERPYKCDLCEKTFQMRRYLILHQRRHTDERPYQCYRCEKKFALKSYLDIHKQTHTSEGYECDLCEKTFQRRRYLLLHQQRHTDERPYQCDLCEKKFTVKTYLVLHKRTHTGARPFKCDLCEKTFSYKLGLVLHKRTHTSE